ncbi:MAG: TetR family transcriptional regulator [Actinobacteria bacterium]|nr:MAG: TetR family transcriptional regulator [Actinomycetota bacterium]
MATTTNMEERSALPLGNGELGRRERKKLATRRALADAALRLFDQQGFDATTVEQIARVVDVSARTFHRYFERKEDVLFADHAERISNFRALLAQRPVDEAPLRSVRLALLISTRELDSRADLEFIRARLITESPALRAYNLRYLDDWARAIAEHVALRTHSKPTDPWPSLAGRCTMAAVIDARQRWVTEGGDSERRVRLVRTGLDLLIRLGTGFAPEKSR